MHMFGEKVTFNWFMFRLTLQTDSFAHFSINSNFHAKCLKQLLIRIGNENERSIGDLVNKHPTAFRPPLRATFNDMFRPSDILRRRVVDFSHIFSRPLLNFERAISRRKIFGGILNCHTDC